VRDRVDLPSWLPPLVAERARAALTAAIEAGSAEDIAVVKRLTTDPRMENVWKYLQRRRREDHYRTSDFENPARDLAPEGSERDRAFPPSFRTRAAYMQHVAMETFYCDVLSLMTGGRFNRFGGPYPTPTPTDEFISQWRTPYRDLAEELQAEAKTISVDPRFIDFPHELHKLKRRLLQAADAYEELASASQGDNIRRVPAAVTAHVARNLKTLFGHGMYSQAATVATIILGRDVTAAEAREWCRKGWVKTHERRP
jgi:hypothetical protein